MKLKLEQRQRQQMKLKPQLVYAACLFAFGLTLGIIALINTADVRTAAASNETYYSIADGNWNDPQTWSTAGYEGTAATDFPRAGDMVYIKGNKIEVNDWSAACMSMNISGSESDETEVNISGNKMLSITQSLYLDNDCNGKNIEINLSGESRAIVGVDLVVSHQTGESDININLIDKGSLTVVGNLLFDLEAEKGLIRLNTDDNTKFNLGGSLTMDNSTTEGQIICSFNGKSRIMVNNDIETLATIRDMTWIELNENARLEMKGNFVRQPSPDDFGKIESFDNSTIVFSGEVIQTIPANQNSTGEMNRLNNVVIKNNAAAPYQVELEGTTTIHKSLRIELGVVKGFNDSGDNLVALNSTEQFINSQLTVADGATYYESALARHPEYYNSVTKKSETMEQAEKD